MSLDPTPSARELRAMAEKRGVLPRNATQGRRSPRQAPSVRPWHPYRSRMERDYARWLDVQRACGKIADWSYEPDTLVIGIGAAYTPDFRITMPDGAIEYRETKGFKREAAMVRLRAAALQYPAFRFVLVTKRNGEWVHHTVGAT